jgi:hypothetical protein
MSLLLFSSDVFQLQLQVLEQLPNVPILHLQRFVSFSIAGAAKSGSTIGHQEFGCSTFSSTLFAPRFIFFHLADI